MKRNVRSVLLLTLACAALAAVPNLAQAQKIDIAFGISTISAPSANSANGNHNAASLDGGAYPGFSGDVLFLHNFGIGAEVFWKGSQGTYPADIYGSGLNYRPVFYNFNAVYSAKVAPHIAFEAVGGIGAMDTHYSVCTFTGASSCGGSQLISSSNHFDVDLGGGLKLYARGGFFVRPEARYYWINNNTDFSSNHATRYGVSIGYTFK
ncbi:MAG: hypothetical protein WBS24_10920 [Terriglobales bacterium]